METHASLRQASDCSGLDTCSSPLAGGTPINNAATPLPLPTPPADCNQHEHVSTPYAPTCSQILSLLRPLRRADKPCLIQLQNPPFSVPSPTGLPSAPTNAESLLPQGFCTCCSCHLQRPWLSFPSFMLPPSELSIIPSGESSPPRLGQFFVMCSLGARL